VYPFIVFLLKEKQLPGSAMAVDAIALAEMNAAALRCLQVPCRRSEEP
jgi:hypothetical protein